MLMGYFPFIEYGKNQIQLGSDSCLTHFFSALDSLAGWRDSKVNIVHIGDSHIQADFVSHYLRERIQGECYFANGGRGFVFPYRLAATNNPGNYKVSYTGRWDGARNSVSRDHSEWGLAGVTAKTTQLSATFEIELNNQRINKEHYEATRVRVYYPVSDNRSLQIRPLDVDTSTFTITYNQEGYLQFDFEEARGFFRFGLVRTDSLQDQFLLQGIAFDNQDPGIVYHSLGVNGAQVDSYLRHSKFSEHLRTLDPDLVIISLGTNDAYNTGFNQALYKHHLRALIAKIREASPTCSILLASPGDGLRRRWQLNSDIADAASSMKYVAEEKGCAFWDFYTVMGGKGSIRDWHHFSLAQGDKLHFTADGYRLQGELLFQALIMDAYFGTYQHIFE